MRRGKADSRSRSLCVKQLTKLRKANASKTKVASLCRTYQEYKKLPSWHLLRTATFSQRRASVAVAGVSLAIFVFLVRHKEATLVSEAFAFLKFVHCFTHRLRLPLSALFSKVISSPHLQVVVFSFSARRLFLVLAVNHHASYPCHYLNVERSFLLL